LPPTLNRTVNAPADKCDEHNNSDCETPNARINPETSEKCLVECVQIVGKYHATDRNSDGRENREYDKQLDPRNRSTETVSIQIHHGVC
jgi:hypothetical protein